MGISKENPEASSSSPEAERNSRTGDQAKSGVNNKNFLAAALVGVVSLTSVLGYLIGAESKSGWVEPSNSQAVMTEEGAKADPSGSSFASSSDMMMPYGGERVIFESQNLSGDEGQSMAWSYSPASSFSKENAEKIGELVGLSGEASLLNGAWSMGSQDWSGPTLQIQPDGLSSLNYYNPLIDPYACMDTPSSVEEGAYESSPVNFVQADKGDSPEVFEDDIAPDSQDIPMPPPCSSNPAVVALSEGEAEAKAQEMLVNLGVDPTQYQLKANLSDKFVYVEAARLNSSSSGSWGFSYYGPDLQSAYGALAPLVELGDYPIVSAEEAVGRLGDSRYAAFNSYLYAATDMTEPAPQSSSPRSAPGDEGDFGSVMPAPDESSMGMAPQQEDEATPSLPAIPAPGDAIEWPVRTVTFTNAKQTTTLYTTPNGASLILPAWELSDANGEVWSVIAIKDGSLNFG